MRPGDAVLDVSGTFTNSGFIDIINWNGTLPPTLVNTGTILDRTAVRQPCGPASVEHPDVAVAVVTQQPPRPAGGLPGGSDPLVSGLRTLGHTVSVSSQSSGISTIVKATRNGATVLEGGADPRREGVAIEAVK